MKKILIFLSIFVFVFGYAVFDAMRVDQMLSGSNISSMTGSVIKKIPDVSFQDLENKEAKIKSYLGKKNLLIHFWATWCAPCEQEFPELVEAIELLHSTNAETQFILIAVDDEDKAVKKFLKKYNVNQDIVIVLKDKSDSHKSFGTYKLPESYLFNSNGQLIKKYPGKQAWMQNHIINFLKNP